MSDVKWIKIATGMFDNRKIKQIRKLPDGDAIIVIWLQIICLAGITNDNGLIYFSKDIPYTDEMLSVEFDRSINVIRLALTTFEKFGMIEIVDNILMVSNWKKYQSTDRLEAIKEKDRERKRIEREQKKQLSIGMSMDVPRTVQGVSQEVPVLDIDIDIDKEIDKEIDKDKDIDKEIKKKKQKHKYGAYQHVLLTDDEMNKLINELGNEMYSKAITYLDEYIEMKGYKAKNHYLVIKKWVVSAVQEKEQKNNKSFYNNSSGKETPEQYARRMEEWANERERVCDDIFGH